MNQWIAMEHYRLHTVEEWPDSPFKEATLAAIYSSLAALARFSPAGTAPYRCQTCRNGMGRIYLTAKRRPEPVNAERAA